MKVYHYHPTTGEFLNDSEADESPLEPGHFLIPQFATELAPPENIPLGKTAVFNSGAWSLVENHRGEVFWTPQGEQKVQEVLGPLPPGSLKQKPPEPPEKAKDLAWKLIKSERDRRIQQGGYKVGAKWYHSDTFSRTQQMGLVMLGANIPANTQWKTMDGSFVAMTQSLAGQIFAVAAQNDMAIFAAAEVHKSAMEASSDPASYDFSTGWPKAFGE